MPLKILTIGGATKDITLETKEGVLIDNKKDIKRQKLLGFELGAKINIPKVNFTFGGGAANTAVALAKLGGHVTTLICVGNDLIGREIINNLKKYKIKINLIQYSHQLSGLSFIIKAKECQEEHILFTYRGANEDLDLTHLHSTKPVDSKYNLSTHTRTDQGHRTGLDLSLQYNFNLIYFTSLSGKNAKINIAKIFRYKNKLPETKIAWNPGNEQIKLGIDYLKTYLKNTDIFIVNKDEAIEICLNNQLASDKRQVTSDKVGLKINNPRVLLNILSKYCPGMVVITDGGNGAYCLHNQKIYYEPSCHVKVKDTTGVGDAFGATFVWALYETNYDIQKSLNLAIKNACSVLGEVGAQNGLLSLSAFAHNCPIGLRRINS